MTSPVQKRSVCIGGFKTSISLETPFWLHLKRIAIERNTYIGDLVGMLFHNPTRNNLSSAIRLFILADLETRAFPFGLPSAASPPIVAEPGAAAVTTSGVQAPGPRRQPELMLRKVY